VLTNLLGVPPQPPPPNIPSLDTTSTDGRVISLRERMEKHRANPTCAGCHKVMDPIGFALESYDGIGRWRKTEDGAPIDTSGTLFNGATIDGVVGLRRNIVAHPEIFVGVMTEKMLTYALGRGLEYYDMRRCAGSSATRDEGLPFFIHRAGCRPGTPFQWKEVEVRTKFIEAFACS
jgi:hypothetical protein